MKNKYFYLFFLLALVGMVGGVFLYKYVSQPKAIHFHAGFQVYIDGKLQDYSDQKYMSLLPCGKVYSDSSLEQAEKAHLHSQVGDIAHIHRAGATWRDLFTNMRISFDAAKPVIGYVNGRFVTDIFHQQIHPYDRVIILIGSHGPVSDYLKHEITVSHIIKIEKGSYEDCGTSAS